MSEAYDALQHLLVAANLLSPTGKEQRGFFQLVDRLQKETPRTDVWDREICRLVIASLYDGLTSGNWPQHK
jgi:hypothetical protein